MSFGERMATVRKVRKLSQDKLASIIGVHSPVIGRYERDEVKPSIETAVKIADALHVSLDYLVGITDAELDSSTLQRVQQIAKLPQEEQKQVYLVVDALLRDFQARQVFQR